MMPTARAYFINIALAFIPDLLICWTAMKLTDNQWSSFWIAFIALQAIYFFFWLKTAVWSWLLYWLYRKRQIAAHLEGYFIDSRFPAPDEYTLDLEDYLSGLTTNEELDCDTRIRAAYENGTLNGMKACQRYSLVFQINSAAKLSMRRYARLAARFQPQ
jgi:hypothetical protein